MAMFGLADGVPVAAYAPRGSDQAVANVRAAVKPGVPAVLLANHGLLVFHRDPELAVFVAEVIEEAARVAIDAKAVGGPSRSRQPCEPPRRKGRWPSTRQGSRRRDRFYRACSAPPRHPEIVST
jgi:ribulose-5-phosphate 4-epimerase/fuculose-1-phosphate aldolase